jgi:serine/threonine protein kinase
MDKPIASSHLVSRSGNLIVTQPYSVVKVIFFPKKTGQRQNIDLEDNLSHPSYVELYFTDLIHQHVDCSLNIVKCQKIELAEGMEKIIEAVARYNLSPAVRDEIHRHLRHENVYTKIGLIEYEKGEQNLKTFIEDNLDNTDLNQILTEYLFQIFFQIHMLKQNIRRFIHGDLKPDNVLLVKDPRYEEGHNRYTCYTYNRRNYYMKVRPLIPKVWDFEFSSSAYRSNQLFNNTYPRWIVNQPGAEEKIDLYRFLALAIYQVPTVEPDPGAGLPPVDVSYEYEYDDAAAAPAPSPDPSYAASYAYARGTPEAAPTATYERRDYIDRLPLLTSLVDSITMNGFFYRKAGNTTLTYATLFEDRLASLREETRYVEGECYGTECETGESLFTYEKKCAVFDFDCTLTATHSVYDEEHRRLLTAAVGKESLEESERTELNDKYFGGPDRVALLKHMFDSLTASNVDIHIASRGNYREIRTLLSSAGLLENVHIKNDQYCINSNKSPYDQDSKDDYLLKLMDTYNNIIYIDDDHTEHVVFVTYTVNGASVDLNFYRLLNQIKPRAESCSPYIEHRYDGTRYVFIPTLRLYSPPRFTEGKGLNADQMTDIVELMQSTTTGDQTGGYQYKYQKYKTKYLRLRSFIN